MFGIERPNITGSILYQAADKSGYFAELGFPKHTVGSFKKLYITNTGKEYFLPEGAVKTDLPFAYTGFDASGSSGIYSGSIVQPKALQILIIIKV